ncbi:DNA gyrase subunit A [Staphylococcus gallinarum]|uniref:DNA gyrase subunit A n=1 Tax=Staphylococcus gallinarum TaxID=1293 RepID=A0A380FBJ7_STAGA|nr:DNA gyrase subunit A [Staphylococcus gallinarum]
MHILKELEEILADEEKLLQIVRDELIEVREKFGDDRSY